MSMSDKKAQLLKTLLRKKGLASKNRHSVAEKITPLNREGISLPLSYAQEQLWFQEQLFPDSPVYNIPVALCIRGDINLEVLTQSLKKIVLRHETLRTTFHQTDFKPVAIVSNTAELNVDLIQISGTELNSRESILSEMQKKVRCIFDLENDLLIKATIWSTDFGECYLLVVVHHIVSDGWSVSILLDELTEFYNAAIREASGEAVNYDSKALPINYIDFSQWQRDAQNSDKSRQHLTYWKEKLSGDLPVLDLPVDFSRPSVATFNGAIRKIQLSDEMSRHLSECSRHYNVTLFMFLLSVFNTLMSRYSGLEDILVGTPVNSRSQKGLENIIGYFINTLVLRTDLSDNPAFSELLARTRDNVLEAFEHQETPLGSLTDELDIGRDLAQSTLFQVMFSLQNVPERTLVMEGLETELIPYDLLHTKTSKVDLNMVVESREVTQEGGHREGLNIWLEYNTDIFNCDSVDKFLTHFRTLLENVLESPEKKLSNLKMLSTEEENTFLADLNHSTPNYHREDLLHHCFNRQVELNPQGIALQYEAQTLTYAQLDQLSNKLANHLLKYKTGPDVLVGICLQRSMELIVGILAILKTGSAYVPLDPAAPGSRLEFIVEDAEIPVLITEEKYFDIFSSQASQLSLLDINNRDIEKCSDSAVCSTVTPENVAYVIYTSGSTGRPKGVLVEHRNVIRLFSATDEWYRFSSDDVWTLFHSCTFDFSVWEIWGALFYGAKLIVVPYWVSRSPDDFYKLLCDEQVTVLNQTPSAFRQLSNVDQQIEEKTDLALRYVIFGGEALDIESLRPWFNRHGDQTPKLVNMYGITETTVHVTYRPISLEDVDAENGSVIGLPIPDLQIYLLDKYLNLVPAGVKGEIFVAGGGVARGYLNRPSLNEERFIEDHITPGATSKLYRSGDLARFLPDGDMEYLGRMDDQVKIRGFRIELGEIETTLNSAASIRQAIVMLQTDASGIQCIVAYYVLNEDEERNSFNIDVLRTYLGNNLPDYMIPQYFIEVEYFSLTSNGKIDRKVLPLPGDAQQASGSAYSAPRNALEKTLSAIWSEVIGLEKIGIHDNFFNIGGHSLLATQVVSRIKNHFKIDLPLRSLFDAGSISKLALQIKDQQNVQTKPPQVQIEKYKGNEPVALSFAQQRLWYLDQLDPENPVYNIPIVYQLTGPLQTDYLMKALEQIYQRHEVLRTSFQLKNNQPVQIIDDAPLQIDVLEVSETDLEIHLGAEVATTFKLDQAPLIRISLLKQSTQCSTLIILVHHTLFDGWSTRVLMKELRQLYTAYTQNTEVNLPEPEIQYSDYSIWQRNWLQGEVLEQQLSYWTEHLAGELPVLELPTDYPRPAHFSYTGKTYSAEIPAVLIDELETCARNAGATVFMAALAAYNTLLYRYTGQNDMITGTIIANRNQSQTENLLGYFANTLAIRTRFSEVPTFAALLSQVRENCLAAYTHQDLPFERLVEVLNPERDPSYTPIYQTLFAYNPLEDLEQALGDIQLQALNTASHVARTDLSFSIEETSQQGYRIEIEYCSDLFSEKRIARLTEHYIHLLQSIVKNPQAKLHELSMLTANEKSCFDQWNQTAVSYSDTGVLLQNKFEQQVKTQPNAIALEFEGEQISYAELDKRANRCANYLHSNGVKPGDYVGIFMLRSIEMLVAIYGTLKAGAAYIPIDPEYPQDRINYIISDANIERVLSHGEVDSTVLKVAQVIDMSTDMQSAEFIQPLPEQSTADDVAYVIYTSGTTGHPKGVMISHRSIINRLEWMQQQYSLDSQDIVLQKTPCAFDVSVWELFWPLRVGARLCIAKPEGHKDPAYLKQLIKSAHVSTLHFVPSMLKVFLDIETLSDCSALKRVYCSGEALPYETTQLFFKDCAAELHNLYGPTEAAVDVSYWHCKPDDERKRVPIGVPVSNTQLYILDDNLVQVPLGATGELFIAGEQLAKGYLNKAALTKEKFLENPFSSSSDKKMYRTGDLVRYLEKGEIEYIGRTDFQVKIRGFRIELGEIESCLNMATQIKQSLVMVQPDTSGAPCIVAYYIQNTNAKEDKTGAELLRHHLGKSLPEYMIPQYFIEVEHFTLTSNGKIDRKALPAPTQTQQDGASEYVAPRNSLEKALSAIWSEVIGLEKIGIHDNFFNIGGHSLLATQVVSRIKNHFKIDLPLRNLFDAGCIRELALQIEEQQNTQTKTRQIQIEKYKGNEPVALSFAQQRLWYLDQLDPENPVYNIPIVYQLTGPLQTDYLMKALEQIYQRHEVLRTSFQLKNNQPVQIIDDAPLQIDVLEVSETDLEIHLGAEVATTFKLDQAPLIRISLLKQSAQCSTLIILVHHTLFDGWSTRVLMKELRQLYTAYIQNTEASLAELDIQYSDYSIWQRNWLQGEVLEQQLSYWTEHLAGELPVLALPTDYPRPNHFSFVGKTYYADIPVSLMCELESLSHSTGTTVFMLALAAYNTLLYRYTGQKDIVVGTIIANRNQSQTENLLGYFANTLAIRTRFSEVPTFAELLSQVRENCLNAYTYQDLPFERLVEALNPDRALSYTPVFQTLFAYNSFTELEQPMEGIEFLAKEVESQVARTDLAFSIGEIRKAYGQSNEQKREKKQYQIEIEYCSDLFNEERIARFAEHYINLLQSIVRNPQAKLYELSMLTEKDRQLITESNNTSRSYLDTQCIHHIISQQVKLNPQAVAISCNGENLSYQQLEDKADKLAQYLSTLDVRADQLIALCINRSADMLVAMLAILKSGAAYLPLDPDYPADRIAFILQDADVSVIITQASIVDILPQSNIKNILLDADWYEQLPPVVATNVVKVKPDNVAYTIYTSGSTGKPKGVLVPHGAVVNFLSSMSEKPGMKAEDVLLAVTTISFDIAVLELFLPLFNGAKIELADREAAADGRVLLEKIDTAGVTVMQATPATWRLMLASGWQQNADLTVLCGGEAMPAELAAELVSHAGRVWNMYGPTETTVWSTLYQITDPQQPVLIGQPIANTQVHILDQNMQLLPAGVAGEMYIAGAGVTQGYLKREALTRERFIKLAIDGAESEVMYRTGDLVRYMQDGNIEYINRLDNQVKVRGFRIELGEIENVLIEHEDVKQVVVIIREDQPGDTRLVAYYLSQDGDEIAVTALRKHLRALLPDYMIPQHFVELEMFPVTPNGKINRLELPAPFSSSAVDDKIVEPGTANEIMLASIWKEVLNTDKVSIHDNFFEIGGHSLLSVQVITKIKEKTGIKLELRPMVMDTLAQIAAQCPEPDIDTVHEEPSADNQKNTQKEKSLIGRLKAKAKSMMSGHK